MRIPNDEFQMTNGHQCSVLRVPSGIVYGVPLLLDATRNTQQAAVPHSSFVIRHSTPEVLNV
jgi:hypothetical protein